MSAARNKSGGVRLPENAASASPRRGVSARSLAPSRLFTASVRDIRNDKIGYSPKGVGQDPPGDAEADEDDEEVNELTSETRPPPMHLLQDREEPSGAETDDCEGEDVAGASSGEARYRESIRVQVFTEPEFDSESEAESEPGPESEPAPKPEPIQGLSPGSCTSDNFEDSIPPVEAEEGKRAPTHSVRSDSNTSDSESGSIRPSKVPVERRKRRSKKREVEGRASSSEPCSSSLCKQKSSDSKSSDSKSSDSKSRKGHRRRQSKSPKRDQKRRHQSSPDCDMATSSRSRSKSACQEQNSSSRRKKHNSTSADSGDEVAVKPRRKDSRVSVDIDYSSTRQTYASTAPDYIPLNGSNQKSESFKPDTPYRMPASQTMNSRGLRGSLPVCYPSPFSPRTYATPPQPAAPTMRTGGLFQWDTYSTRDSPSSLSPLVHAPNALPYHVPPPLPPQECDRRFRCLQNLHSPPKPNFNGFQLIGDSMLLRFSQQLLGENAIMAESLRFLGYCVSGQTVGELLRRLRSGFYHLGKKVVLMIGTNDLLKSTHLQQMCTELRRVVELLQQSVEELIVLTIPPVPRLENLTYHWKRLNTYNDFIKGLSDKGPPLVKPVDICKLFEDRRISRCRMECFETFFSDSKRKDMIHLNRKGLTVVRDELYKAI